MAEKTVAVKLTARIDAYKRAMKDAKRSTTDLASSAKKIDQLGTKVTQVGSSLSKVSLPLIAAGGFAVKMASDFETSMTKIQTLVGLSAADVDAMGDAVLRLAGQTAQSPQALADALFVVTSAGLRGAEAMDALEFAAKGSAIGLGQTNDIARAVAGVMNAYGTDVLNASEATDILAATARAGNFETSELAGSLGRVLPWAKQAGTSFEDVGGAVALLTRTNGNAAESITQVQGLLKQFVAPTQGARTVLNELGLTAEDVREHMGENGLVSTLQMLDDKMGGNREKMGQLIGRAEGTAAAFQILDADADTLEATFGVTNDAIGLVSEGFAQVADTDSHKMRAAFAALQASMIDIGAIIMPVLAGIASGVSDIVGGFSDLPGPVQTAIIALAGVAAVLGPMLIVVGSLIRAWGALRLAMAAMSFSNPVFLALAAVAGAAALAITIFSDSSAGAKLNIDDLTDSMRNAQSPLTGMTEQIASLADKDEKLRKMLVAGGGSFEGLAEAALAGELSLRNYAVGLINHARETGVSIDYNTDLENTLLNLVPAADAARTKYEEMTKLQGDAADVTEEAATATANYDDVVGMMAESLGVTREEALALMEVTEESAEATDVEAEAKENAAAASERYARQLDREKERIDGIVDSLREEAEQLEARVSAQLSMADRTYALIDSEDAFTQAVKDANDALAANKDEIDDNDVSMRELQQLFNSAAEAAQDNADATLAMAEAQAEREGVTLSESDSIAILNGQLLAQADATDGPVRDAILNHIALTNDIPLDRVTEIAATVDDVGLAAATDALNDASAPYQTQIIAESKTADAEKELDDFAKKPTYSDIFYQAVTEFANRSLVEFSNEDRPADIDAVAQTSRAGASLSDFQKRKRVAPIDASARTSVANRDINNAARSRSSKITAYSVGAGSVNWTLDQAARSRTAIIYSRVVNTTASLNARDSGGSAPPGSLVSERRPEFVGGAFVATPQILGSAASITGGAATEAKFDRMMQLLERGDRGGNAPAGSVYAPSYTLHFHQVAMAERDIVNAVKRADRLVGGTLVRS